MSNIVDGSTATCGAAVEPCTNAHRSGRPDDNVKTSYRWKPMRVSGRMCKGPGSWCLCRPRFGRQQHPYPNQRGLESWCGRASVTALVAVSGGVFAYFKFARGRIFKPRCLLSLAASTLRVGGASALRVDIAIKNDGQSALLLDPRYTQRLDVFTANAAVWDDAVTSGDGVLLWFDGTAPSRSLEIVSDPGLLTYAIPVYKDYIARPSRAVGRSARTWRGAEAFRPHPGATRPGGICCS